MLNLTEPYPPFSTTTFEAFALRGTLKTNTHFTTPQKSLFALRACQDIPHHTCPHNTQRSQRIKHPWLSSPTYPSGKLQYQSSFYKPKTYKDMEEKTLFKLARAIITDTGTDTVSSKGGTITYRITSLKRKLVNGKVVSTSTPYCTLGSASVSWAIWGGVTVGDGYLDVKINYSENTGSSRSTTLIFDQIESDNKIHLTVTQETGITYSGYIKMVSNTLPLGSIKYDTAQILVMAYLNGSDGSKKPETPHVGNAPDWCSVSITSMDTVLENHYMLSLTALSSNQTGANRSGHIFLTCGDANLSIPVTQKFPAFTLSGLPTDTGYYLFGREARPQNTSSSDKAYIQGLSATSTITMKIPFYANDSEPGSQIECTTGDKVTVYTKPGATWILKGSFIVPRAEGKVSI